MASKLAEGMIRLLLEVNPRAASGDMTLVADWRRKCDLLEKDEFDQIALSLAKEGKVSLHKYDRPGLAKTEVLAQMIQDSRGDFYNTVSLPESVPLPNPTAEYTKGKLSSKVKVRKTIRYTVKGMISVTLGLFTFDGQNGLCLHSARSDDPAEDTALCDGEYSCWDSDVRFEDGAIVCYGSDGPSGGRNNVVLRIPQDRVKEITTESV